jgi:hypothetical protein
MSFPTPEEERQAILALLGLATLTVLGAISFIAAVCFVVIRLIKGLVS